MQRKNKKGYIEFIFSLVVLVLAICGITYLERATCFSKWEHSGLPTQWGPIKGCLVKVPSGMWVPSETIRELDIKEGRTRG